MYDADKCIYCPAIKYTCIPHFIERLWIRKSVQLCTNFEPTTGGAQTFSPQLEGCNLQPTTGGAQTFSPQLEGRKPSAHDWRGATFSPQLEGRKPSAHNWRGANLQPTTGHFNHFNWTQVHNLTAICTISCNVIQVLQEVRGLTRGFDLTRDSWWQWQLGTVMVKSAWNMRGLFAREIALTHCHYLLEQFIGTSPLPTPALKRSPKSL